MLCNIVRQIEKCKKKKCTDILFSKWGFKKWNCLRCTKSKNWPHFSTPTFYDLQLCTLVSGRMIRFEHFKWPKNAPCLWFGHFSSHLKCCRHTCMQCFMRELKHLNQRQDAFSGPLKCSNHPGTKVQSCRSQKVGMW